MTAPGTKLDQPTVLDHAAEPSRAPLLRMGGMMMLLCQLVLGIVFLLIWQGASGRLVDNFFISNPIDVGGRLFGWILDGSIFRHIWATVYATAMGFLIGAIG